MEILENIKENFLGLTQYKDCFVLQTDKSTFYQLIFNILMLFFIFILISVLSFIVLSLLRHMAIIPKILFFYFCILSAYIIIVITEVVLFSCKKTVLYFPEDNMIEINDEQYDIKYIECIPILKGGISQNAGGMYSFGFIFSKAFEDMAYILSFHTTCNKVFNVYNCFINNGHEKAISDSIYKPNILCFNFLIYPFIILLLLTFIYK